MAPDLKFQPRKKIVFCIMRGKLTKAPRLKEESEKDR